MIQSGGGMVPGFDGLALVVGDDPLFVDGDRVLALVLVLRREQ
jgi:hypothetical protein